jgi:hypothetical protein
MQKIQHNIHYQPHRLFDVIRHIRGLRSDTELAGFLQVGRPLISKVRRGYLPLSGGLLLRIHEVTAFDIGWLKAVAGDRRKLQRVSENKLIVKPARSTAEVPHYTRAAPLNWAWTGSGTGSS